MCHDSWCVRLCVCSTDAKTDLAGSATVAVVIDPGTGRVSRPGQSSNV